MSKYVEKIYPIIGMHCASCANNIERGLDEMYGVRDATVNLASSLLNITYDADSLSPEVLKKEVEKLGYTLIINAKDSIEEQEEQEHKLYNKIKIKTIVAWLLAIPILAIGLFFGHSSFAGLAMLVLTIPIIVYSGSSFYVMAYKQAKRFSSNMDTLVSLSTLIAFIFSLFNTFFPSFWYNQGLYPHVYYEAVAMIIAFVLLGKLMENKAKGKTTNSIRKLIGLQPQTAFVVIDENKIEEKKIEDIVVGDKLSVRPGEKIPVDGIILDGETFVDESMINGEPIPSEKKINDLVLAGTINKNGAFIMTAKKVGKETMLANIIQKVRQAQGSKAPVQRIVDKVTAIFVPVIILISIFTFLVWLFVGGKEYISYGVLSAVSVLVIACPCALGLATPTALMVGIGKAADMHILIKDAIALEQMKKVNIVVLDKTGTVTEGKPVVVGHLHEAGLVDSHKDVLMAAELRSEHPLAQAIVEALKKDDVEPAKIDFFESRTGLGVIVKSKGQTFWIGSYRMTKQYDAEPSKTLKDMISEFQDRGDTIIYFGVGSLLLSAIAINDKIKPTSVKAVKMLHAMGKYICLLTGDGHNTAQTVAGDINADRFVYDALPMDKENVIMDMQKKGNIVAMVGDGINDSQALARADVSIAMGKGTDVAMDVAMITLITSDLMLLPKAFRISKMTVRLIKQNLFWAFIYNIIGIPIAAGILFPHYGILLNPMIASAAMACSSVSVVLNSLSLNWRRI